MVKEIWTLFSILRPREERRPGVKEAAFFITDLDRAQLQKVMELS